MGSGISGHGKADKLLGGLFLNRLEKSAVHQDINQFAGDYYCDEQMVTYHLFTEGKTLYLTIGFKSKQELRPSGEDLFNADDFLIHFRRDAKNEVIGLDVAAELGRVQNLIFVKQNPESSR